MRKIQTLSSEKHLILLAPSKKIGPKNYWSIIGSFGFLISFSLKERREELLEKSFATRPLDPFSPTDNLQTESYLHCNRKFANRVLSSLQQKICKQSLIFIATENLQTESYLHCNRKFANRVLSSLQQKICKQSLIFIALQQKIYKMRLIFRSRCWSSKRRRCIHDVILTHLRPPYSIEYV